jgi:drug/metabolite transporter superfamily protein YnfA
MSLPSGSPLTPLWLNELAPNATLISSVLNRPLQSRDAVIKVIQAVGGLYEAHAVVFQAPVGDRILLEYDALAFGGVAVHGVVMLSRNPAGEISEVSVHHSPLEAVSKISAALRERLSAELGVDYFLP